MPVCSDLLGICGGGPDRARPLAIRHDAAHVLAEAVQELYPGTQVTIGPAIENGFYYDFARDEPFTPDDLAKIEKRMREIVDRDEPITREVWDRDEAIAHFRTIGEAYKAELIDACPPTSRSRSTARATGSTCAAARTCPRRQSARPSS
jgi:threonyl-tRNA synthetase